MTVSPRWPQDGTPAPESVSDHAAANESNGTNPPPTLLRLPNLKAAPVPPLTEVMSPENLAGQHPAAQHPAAQHQSAQNPFDTNPAANGFSGGQPQPNQSNEVPGATGQPAPAAAWAAANSQQPVFNSASTPGQPTAPAGVGPAGTASVDPCANPGQATDPNYSGRTFPNLSDPGRDAPAGRSWMEIAQQHGVVFLLLLIVVATAVFTGRETGVNDSDVTIVDAVDLFGVEDGIAVDMPMSDHTDDAATGMVTSPQAIAVQKSDDIGFAEDLLADSVAIENQSRSVASLEPPRTTAEQPAVAAQGQNQPRIVENQFVQQLEAKTVANRFNASSGSSSDITFNAPSLEELASSLPDEETNVAPQAPAVQQQSPVVTRQTTTGAAKTPAIPAFGQPFGSRSPTRSKTPIGISDWTQYLPELPSATSK